MVTATQQSDRRDQQAGNEAHLLTAERALRRQVEAIVDRGYGVATVQVTIHNRKVIAIKDAGEVTTKTV